MHTSASWWGQPHFQLELWQQPLSACSPVSPPAALQQSGLSEHTLQSFSREQTPPWFSSAWNPCWLFISLRHGSERPERPNTVWPHVISDPMSSHPRSPPHSSHTGLPAFSSTCQAPFGGFARAISLLEVLFPKVSTQPTPSSPWAFARMSAPHWHLPSTHSLKLKPVICPTLPSPLIPLCSFPKAITTF